MPNSLLTVYHTLLWWWIFFSELQYCNMGYTLIFIVNGYVVISGIWWWKIKFLALLKSRFNSHTFYMFLLNWYLCIIMLINDISKKLYIWIFCIPRVSLCVVPYINLIISDEVVHNSSIIVIHYVKLSISVSFRGVELQTVGSFSGWSCLSTYVYGNVPVHSPQPCNFRIQCLNRIKWVITYSSVCCLCSHWVTVCSRFDYRGGRHNAALRGMACFWVFV